MGTSKTAAKIIIAIVLLRLVSATFGNDHYRAPKQTSTPSTPKLQRTRRTMPLPSFRILHGAIAAMGQFPYHAFIVGDFTDDDPPFNATCNGAIISHTVILSAASCYDIDDPQYYTVYLSGIRRRMGYKHSVTKIIKHPDFHMRSDDIIANDVALIRIQARLDFGRYVRRVAIGWIFSHVEDVVVSGFGAWRKSSGPSDDLRFIRTRTIPHQECLSRYLPIELDITYICTLHQRFGASIGDEGSPLVATNGRIIGMVAKAYKEENYPRFYVRLSEYVDWINIHLGRYE